MDNEVGEVVKLAQIACPMDHNGELKRFENYCYNCGTGVKNQKYCKNCGSKLDWANKNHFQEHLYDWVYEKYGGKR